MSHFAVITPPLFSHMQAMQALARQLMLRGHQITFIHQSDARQYLSLEGAAFHAVGSHSHPQGALARTLWLSAHPGGLSVLRLIDALALTTAMLCHELPAALEALAVDGIIADQMEAAGGLVAEALGIPFVSVACALPVNREQELPLPVMPFRYAVGEAARQRYDASEKVYDWLMRRHGEVIAREAQRFGLAPRHGLHECLSPLAQISQTIPAFDFPRHQLPGWFHAVGPLRDTPVATIPLPQPALPVDARPLVYASLGTLQGHRYRLFHKIACACRRLDLQLLIAHCGGLSPGQEQKLLRCGASDVTDFVCQTAVLQQASAVITHAGLNTVIDALESSTPVLAVPLAFDQPGVAARVEFAGIGRRVSRYATLSTFTSELNALMQDGVYQHNLRLLRPQLHAAGGAARAARVTEQALRERRPVLAEVA